MTVKLTRRTLLKASATVGVGLVGSTVLGACAPKEPTPAPTAAPKAAAKEPTKPAAKEPVTLQLHMRAGGENSEAPIYVMRPGEFMEENPDIKVELAPIPGGEYYAKIQTMAAAKTIGDVMWTADVWTDHSRLVRLGVLGTVDDHLDAHGKSKDEWLPACVDTLTHDGKMYGLPKCSHPGDSYIWVNLDLLAEAGIDEPPVHGVTHEQISEWAEKLSKGPANDREVYGFMPCVNQIMALFNSGRSFGAWENVEDGTESLYDSAEWWEWAQWLGRFYTEKYATIEGTLPSGGITALFSGGKLAMMHRQRYMNKRVKQAVEELGNPFKWKVIEYPRPDNANGWVACVDTHTATASTKYPDEAFLLTYAMADPRFTELVASNIGYMGGRMDDLDTVSGLLEKDPFLKLQYECMLQEEKFRQPPNARGREIQTALINSFDAMWLGEEEITQDYMKQVKAAVDEIIAKPF